MCGQELGRRLLDVSSRSVHGDGASVVDALVLAGEVECALRDCGWGSADKAAQITDVLARRFLSGEWEQETCLDCLAAEVARLLPEKLRISPPEGFAYYALHPGDFADAVHNLPTQGPVGVVGIRSVGTTLSAVVVAALKKRGLAASRITVRPIGHPYDRKVELDTEQKSRIRDLDCAGAAFLVIDEGPGLSGSSFLSTGEALVREGIGAERITLIGTHDVNPGQLCASDASARWQKFHWRRVPSRISRRFDESTRLSGGLWREFFLGTHQEWPACWPEMDAVKYLSKDEKNLFKFDGFGEGGCEARRRARVLADSGFGPVVDDAGDGMSRYQFLQGRPLVRADLSCDVLDRMAEYCALRVHEFRHDSFGQNQMEDMVRFNYSQEKRHECPIPGGRFQIDCAVICDGRMAPHEWIGCGDGTLLKVDGCKDGDDHFLPGPSDIAWDLAGAIVEWDMSRDAQDYFLAQFRRKSGIGTGNVAAFLLGYSVFRASYCKMAWMGTAVEAEKPRLEQAYRFYSKKMDDAVRALEHMAVM